MKPALFQDGKLQSLFNDKGYIRIPFLSSKELDQIIRLYHQLHPNGIEGKAASQLYCTINSEDREYKFKIHEELKRILQPLCDQLFQNHKNLIYAMLIKGRGENSKLGVHQDWSIVDETKFDSCTLWIPLVDSTVENGTLYLLEGSHKFAPKVRGGTIQNPFLENAAAWEDKMLPIEVKAGEALIFNAALLHFSPPNLSPESRVSVISPVTSKDAEIYYYYQSNSSANSVVEIFEQPDNFWLLYDNFPAEKELAPPMGKKVGEQAPPGFGEFEQLAATMTSKKKNPFQKLLYHLLGN